MKKSILEIPIVVYDYDELPEMYRMAVDEAKKATASAYADYSKFNVGAAVLLENNEIITGSNQENAAYPSGLCAERVAMFYANSKFPEVAPKLIAIAAFTNGDFLTKPITPCGACRQVLLESETRYGTDIEVLLYGKNGIYKIRSVKDLLPLSFNESDLNR